MKMTKQQQQQQHIPLLHLLSHKVMNDDVIRINDNIVCEMPNG